MRVQMGDERKKKREKGDEIISEHEEKGKVAKK